VQSFRNRVVSLPDGSVVIRANAGPAYSVINGLINSQTGRSISLRAYINQVENASGNVLEFMAQGGMRRLTPMSHTAQVVPPSTWRVVGDRGDVPESFIPIDGSARSMSILLETMRRMGVMPMATGGITVSNPGIAPRPASGITVEFNGPIGANADDVIRKLQIAQRRAQMMFSTRGVGVA
jgi:hypothetical protein